MDREKFKAHGEVRAQFLEAKGILFIDLVGPFNLEFMQKYEGVVGLEREKIDQPCWGSLVNVHGLALAPMEATISGQAIVAKATSTGLIATAIVLHESEGKALQKIFWSRVYASSQLPYKYFDATEEAEAWLSDKLFISTQACKIDQRARVKE